MNTTMNGFGGPGAPPSLWQEAKNAEGRTYYYHSVSKVTQWEKPDDLKTASERALSNQPWKEYTAEGGRKYWYNTETKQSSWEVPAVYKDALALEATPTVAAVPEFVAGGGYSSYDSPRDREPIGEVRQIAYNNDVNSSRAQAFVPANNDPDYSTYEEAESAFMKLLRKSNVQPDWTWEQTMRSIIKDPQYRSLKDPKDRRAAFEKYAVETRILEKDRAKERLAKLRADFSTMLKSHPEIKHYTRWKTARLIIAAETIFKSANDDNERRQLFEDYIVDLKKANLEREAISRKAAMDDLVDLLRKVVLEPYTRWSDAQNLIQSHPKGQNNEKFKSLNKSDILTAFENHIKGLERTVNDSKQQQKNLKYRRERQNRDRYKDLLNELKAAGKVKAGTKWMDIHGLLENDERYKNMLGQPGSTPMDFFWDLVEEEERALRSTRNDVLDVLDDKRFEIQQKTSFEEFLTLMQSDRRTSNINRDSLALIFERLRDKISRRTEDDKHQAERQQRRMVDNLRSYIKHLEPPVRMSDSYEAVLPRFEKSEDYIALPDDELRRSAFEKVIRRLKEKDEDAERDRLKRRERSSMERSSYRERDRERDRGDRRGNARHGRSSRSPEPDAYEADRRKAIADREKNYRKANVVDSLLSPRRGSDRGDRDRDRDRADRERERERERDRERDRDPDRPHRSRREDDRLRRDVDDERERMYRRRGDPKGSIDELPYGDDKPSTSRRRRADSEEQSVSSRRDSKRPRRGSPAAVRDRSPAPGQDRQQKTRTPPPAAAAVPKDDAAVHSGSEEGEIEEE